jgi:secreted PhoX family phosphatase
MKKLVFVAAAVAAALSVHAADFGQKVEALAKSQSLSLFGVSGTLGASSAVQRTAAELEADPTSAITVAPGLTVKVVSKAANLGANIDQMVLWPNSTSPTHIIACNEQSALEVGVQRISLATGVAENIISGGLGSCDPVRLTPWGTILAGEETGGGGRLFEILDPLTTTGVTISGSGGATTTTDTAHVRFVSAVGTLSWEGLAVLPNGVMYSTDESRPVGAPGGSVFKFIPNNLWTGGAPITSLDNSPFNAGRIFGLRVGRNSNTSPDSGWGNEYGRGWWVEVTNRADVGSAPINLRTAAATLKLTGYYRPEDADFDEKEFALGNVRFCGTNTGQDVPDTTATGDNHWGEVYCLRDGTFTTAAQIATSTQTISGVNYTVLTSTVPEYQALVMGNREFAMMDNIAYHPTRGFWVMNEDGEGPTYPTKRNNDIWGCLDDGADQDKLSDACVKLMTLNDLLAESTGGVFDASGTRYFVSIQHNITGHGIILEVNGWL